MTTKSRFTRLAIILGSTAALGLASCGNDDSSSACPTIESGKLTIATGTPAFEPWVVGDAPESGEGFEAAVAYAVAGELGYTNENVVWVRTGFDEAIQPGAKNFDFNLQQYS
ncbi:MAG: amino acid ABC transporter substrate-binding protein, partial [bacterium]